MHLYLLCHGTAQTGSRRHEKLGNITLGVYTELGDPLQFGVAKIVLENDLEPVYRPADEDVPEFILQGFPKREEKRWDEHAGEIFNNSNVRRLGKGEETTLSAYLKKIRTEFGGAPFELRLLACASHMEGTAPSASRKESAPKSWRPESAGSETLGFIADSKRRTEEVVKKYLDLHNDGRELREIRGFIEGLDDNKAARSEIAISFGTWSPIRRALKLEGLARKADGTLESWYPFIKVLTPNSSRASAFRKDIAAVPAAYEAIENWCISLNAVVGEGRLEALIAASDADSGEPRALTAYLNSDWTPQSDILVYGDVNDLLYIIASVREFDFGSLEEWGSLIAAFKKLSSDAQGVLMPSVRPVLDEIATRAGGWDDSETRANLAEIYDALNEDDEQIVRRYFDDLAIGRQKKRSGGSNGDVGDDGLGRNKRIKTAPINPSEMSQDMADDVVDQVDDADDWFKFLSGVAVNISNNPINLGGDDPEEDLGQGDLEGNVDQSGDLIDEAFDDI
ncbi:hypothetical protein AB0D08_35235 [Kitasatospora sp. NPDC048540]|uniref:hypothetical protein n=1 Tax=Kitasatospora sp. NPDC048540 TaxID=3155634 RepID=UPI00340FBE97